MTKELQEQLENAMVERGLCEFEGDHSLDEYHAYVARAATLLIEEDIEAGEPPTDDQICSYVDVAHRLIGKHGVRSPWTTGL